MAVACRRQRRRPRSAQHNYGVSGCQRRPESVAGRLAGQPGDGPKHWSRRAPRILTLARLATCSRCARGPARCPAGRRACAYVVGPGCGAAHRESAGVAHAGPREWRSTGTGQRAAQATSSRWAPRLLAAHCHHTGPAVPSPSPCAVKRDGGGRRPPPSSPSHHQRCSSPAPLSPSLPSFTALVTAQWITPRRPPLAPPRPAPAAPCSPVPWPPPALHRLWTTHQSTIPHHRPRTVAPPLYRYRPPVYRACTAPVLHGRVHDLDDTRHRRLGGRYVAVQPPPAQERQDGQQHGHACVCVCHSTAWNSTPRGATAHHSRQDT